MLAAFLIPGIAISSWAVALVVALVLGLINTFIKPVLGLLTLPINFLTLGLFGLVLNALLFWAVSYFVPGFMISGFLPALLGSILVSIVMGLTHVLL